MKSRPHKRSVGVSATEAAKNFGRLIDRVRETRATYVVERGGKPVVSIAPVEREVFTMRDLKALFGDRARASAEYLETVERVSSRRNRPRVRRTPWGR
jgi:antitoxin (DNA-binding transcriptional repressor) of toxin-antitoxin stability system